MGSHGGTGGTSGGVGGFCFLNALVARRKPMRASMPSLVPRMSDVTRSSDAFLRIWHWSSYVGQVVRMWSRDCRGSLHGQEQSSVGTCLL